MTLARGDVVARSNEVERALERDDAVEAYRARHLLSGRKALVKVLACEEPWCEALIERSIRLTDATDPALAECLGAGPAGRTKWFYAFAVVNGPTLDTVRNASFTAEHAALMGLQRAGALAALHDVDVAHGHVRPSRVTLSEKHHFAPKLLDFVVPPVDAIAGQRAAYLAPVVEGGAPSPAADVFALGMLLRRLLAGPPAECGGGRVEILLRSLFAPPAPVRCDDEALTGWLAAMTAERDADRPSAREVHEALSDVAGGRAAAAPPPSGRRERSPITGVILLRAPSSKEPREVGLDAAWRQSVETLGARVHELPDGSLLCRVDRGAPSAIATSVGLALRVTQERAFRATAAAGLLRGCDAGAEAELAEEITEISRLVQRTPPGVARATARLALPTVELFVDDGVAGGVGPGEASEHPTVEIAVDESLVEATRPPGGDAEDERRGG